jgi:ABC-2 type transport system ATP-binding protein
LIQRLLRMTRMEPFRARRAAKLSGGMKQKLALMCTLLHHPQVLFLDEPTNGVDPVSRRDFWAILYQLVRDGLTVFVTTAYLDEAERCNRVGLMDHGRMIRCDSPQGLKRNFEKICFEIETSDQRAARVVLNAEPYGAKLHLFLPLGQAPDSVENTLAAHGIRLNSLHPIIPSLEDVFIGLIRDSQNAA